MEWKNVFKRLTGKPKQIPAETLKPAEPEPDIDFEPPFPLPPELVQLRDDQESRDYEKHLPHAEGRINFRTLGRENGLQEYRRVFLFEPADMLGKKILNLGAGPVVRFEQELLQELSKLPANTSAPTDIFSISPDWGTDSAGKRPFQDILDTMLKHVPAEIREHIHPIAATGESLPLADESMDTVFIQHVFEHTHSSTRLKILREVSRVLKQGGRLYVEPLKVQAEYYVDGKLFDRKTNPGHKINRHVSDGIQPANDALTQFEHICGPFHETKRYVKWQKTGDGGIFPFCSLTGYFEKPVNSTGGS